MTTSVALPVNTTPAAQPSTPSSSSDAQSDFSKPWQQARQQAAQQSEPAKPAAKHTSSRSHAPSSSSGGKHDHQSSNATTPTPTDATTAMLALLGQSVPASAAPSDVSEGADDATTTATTTAATTAASGAAASTVSLLGALQAGTAAKPASVDDDSKATDGIQDASLTLFAQGADDDATDTAPTKADAAPAVKGDTFASALQALTSGASSKKDDGSDALEALKNLAASATAQQGQTPLSTTTTPASHVLTMQSSVDSPAFGQELSQQVTWLGGQDVKEARIRLHPEDMGELDVKVSVKQDHVDVQFIAQHPQAVHAVQQTLSQLDSMLAHHGLSLGQAMVGQGNTGGGSSQAGSSAGKGASGGEGGLAEGVEALASVAAPVVKAVGLVDMFV